VDERAVRIAAVPAAHPYVRAVRPPGHVLLPDPPVPGAPEGQWWPPVVLGSSWLRRHAGSFDVVHLHFGAESSGVDELRETVATLRRLGRPLVHTVHDLVHPHLADQTRHLAQLEVLVAGADELLTLTEAAAEQVDRRYGRRPQVVAHPQIATDAWFARADAARRSRGAAAGPRVGVHLRSLRANVRPGPWLGPLAAAVADLCGSTTVLVNDDVRSGTAGHDALRAATTGTPVDVVVRPRPGDDDLARELTAFDVSVLPYTHGTHSGWLELCWDLGIGVLAPAVGAFADQHREPWAVQSFAPDRPDDVVAALHRLLGAGGAPDAAERLRARRRTAEHNHVVHAAVYAAVLRGGSGGEAPPSAPPVHAS